VPDISARDAGANLARIAARHELTLFAHYATDYAGHQRSMDAAVAAIGVIDEFLAGLIAAMPDDVLLVASSDHGNIEDITTDHTLNPVIGLAAGYRHAEVALEWTSILDIAPAILRLLDVD
jgi:bisphosphoglycerate-independent phosphoglycerate mutase (AlkP superfamily)